MAGELLRLFGGDEASPPPPQHEDETRVYECWRGYQERPDACKLSEGRQRLIRRALRQHTAADLVALITYANEADTDEAAWWQGRNTRSRDGRPKLYLDLSSLLADKDGRLAGRVERAVAWLHRGNEPTGNDSAELLRALANRIPGQALPEQAPALPPATTGARRKPAPLPVHPKPRGGRGGPRW